VEVYLPTQAPNSAATAAGLDSAHDVILPMDDLWMDMGWESISCFSFQDTYGAMSFYCAESPWRKTYSESQRNLEKCDWVGFFHT
jgi:hypothetical protein